MKFWYNLFHPQFSVKLRMKKSSIILFFAIPTFCSIGIILSELHEIMSPNPEQTYQEAAPKEIIHSPEDFKSKPIEKLTQPQSQLGASSEINVSKVNFVSKTTTPTYDMSWINIYGKNTPELLVKSWTVWRNSQGTDNYAVRALGEAVKSFPQEQRHIVLSEVLYKIENEKDYYDFVKYNPELFESAYAELEKGQEDLSEPSAMVLTALGRCRVKWHFQPLHT